MNFHLDISDFEAMTTLLSQEGMSLVISMAIVVTMATLTLTLFFFTSYSIPIRLLEGFLATQEIISIFGVAQILMNNIEPLQTVKNLLRHCKRKLCANRVNPEIIVMT